MKTYTMTTVLRMIKQGRIECVTDLKVGYVSIRSNVTRKITIIEVKA